MATACGNGDAYGSGQAQGRLVEQTRLNTQSLKLAVFDGETPSSQCGGFQPGFYLSSEP